MALVGAGPEHADVRAAFPSSQFNHAILCMPLAAHGPVPADTVWLECTSQTERLRLHGLLHRQPPRAAAHARRRPPGGYPALRRAGQPPAAPHRPLARCHRRGQSHRAHPPPRPWPRIFMRNCCTMSAPRTRKNTSPTTCG
ncbi:MAG: hypothetical protein WKG07_02695 [Hymenobacter sp.]